MVYPEIQDDFLRARTLLQTYGAEFKAPRSQNSSYLFYGCTFQLVQSHRPIPGAAK